MNEIIYYERQRVIPFNLYIVDRASCCQFPSNPQHTMEETNNIFLIFVNREVCLEFRFLKLYDRFFSFRSNKTTCDSCSRFLFREMIKMLLVYNKYTIPSTLEWDPMFRPHSNVSWDSAYICCALDVHISFSRMFMRWDYHPVLGCTVSSDIATSSLSGSRHWHCLLPIFISLDRGGHKYMNRVLDKLASFVSH